MSDIFIKNTSGEIWKNTSGAIFKAKKFNEMPIQQGLTFWGAADPAYLTLVDGLVSEAYDIRGTGQKMIQNTVIYRPEFIISELLFNATLVKLTIANSTAYSFFMVLRKVTSTLVRFMLGDIAYSNGYLGAENDTFVLYGTNRSLFYYNNVLKPTFTYIRPNVNQSILSGVNNTALNVNMIGFQGSGNEIYVKEWGWYNRPLTQIEVIYNINALNAKYQIF